MSLFNNGMSPADIAAVTGNNNDGFGGDGGWWIIVLLLAFANGGWGNGFGGNAGGSGLWPYFFNNTDNNTQRGFDTAAISNQIASVANAVNTGFASSEVANCNRAMDAMQTAYTNQIADLNRSFDSQTAIGNQLDTLEMSLQKCCCDNQLATESLRYTVATENAADRAELSNGIRDLITNQNAGIQRVLDQLCSDKIDAKNEQIANLQTQLNMAGLAASQANQTAQLIADNTAQTQALIQRIAPYPIPAYPVGNPYGYNYGYSNNYCNNGFGFNPFGNVGFGNGSF